jgi:hypothetical protein
MIKIYKNIFMSLKVFRNIVFKQKPTMEGIKNFIVICGHLGSSIIFVL